MLSASSSSGRSQPTSLDSELPRSVSADLVGPEADRELLPNLTVVVGDDVLGVAVDSDESGDLDLYTRFLAHFADHGATDAFPQFYLSAGQGPPVVVGAVDEKNPPLVVDHERRHCGHDRVRPGCGRIVVVVAAGHQSACGRASSRVPLAHTRSKVSR